MKPYKQAPYIISYDTREEIYKRDLKVWMYYNHYLIIPTERKKKERKKRF